MQPWYKERHIQPSTALAVIEPKEIRKFDGASRTDRLAGWRTPIQSVNQDLRIGGDILRARCRDLSANNPNVHKARSEFVNALVGTGIKCRVETEDPQLNAKVESLLSAFFKVCDSRIRSADDSGIVFEALQRTWAYTLFDTGEIVIRRRYRRLTDNLPIAMQLETLAAEYVDESWNIDREDGSRIILGVEYDALGRKRGYYVRPRFPGDGPGSVGMTLPWSKFVPVSDLILAYESVDGGQVRGIPAASAVVITAKDTDDAADAERVRMRVQACFTAFVTSEETSGIGPTVSEDSEGNPITTMEPGLITFLRGGKTVTTPTPSSALGWADFDKAHLTRVAAGLGMSYERVSGDLSGTSFSSIRIGDNSFKTSIEALQATLFIPQVCNPCVKWALSTAIAQGLIPDREYPVRWIPPPWRQVDSETRADEVIKRMRGGLMSPQDAILVETGRDWREVIRETAEFTRECEANGITFDSLAVHIASNGQAQSTTNPPKVSDGGKAPL